MNNILLRIILIIPWAFIIWLIGRGFSGSMDGLVVFLLVLLLVPMAIVANVVTVLYTRGSAVFKQLRDVQRATKQAGKQDTRDHRVEAVNYADLAWYDVRRFKDRL